MKNIKSWCKLVIPSMIGVALSWKNICQGVELSKKLLNKDIIKNEKYEKTNKIMETIGIEPISFVCKTNTLPIKLCSLTLELTKHGWNLFLSRVFLIWEDLIDC